MSGESATMPVWYGILATILLLTGVAPSLAQGYPNRPVRVVVGFPAGGPTDVIARLVAQRLSESLGQQFFVENIGGAGGNTAAGQVARVNPDGYTIMAISTGFMVNPSLYAKVPYDPIKDFSAVTLVAVSPNVVVVNPSVLAKTLPELVQLIRNNPGKYSYAGPGVGSTPHLGGELFRLTYKLDLVHIPFAGAAPAVQSTVGGHTPIAFTALPSSLSAIQSGQVRAIGIAATERAAAIPDVPTFAEQGVHDQDADTLTGIVAPAGTPKEIARRGPRRGGDLRCWASSRSGTSRFLGCRLGAFVLCEGSHKLGNQRPQFIQRWNVHEQGDIPANFLLTDLEFNVQKQHKG
jgi:tripartite-type tricarboxylate transporter receptor subunit TctC